MDILFTSTMKPMVPAACACNHR